MFFLAHHARSHVRALLLAAVSASSLACGAASDGQDSLALPHVEAALASDEAALAFKHDGVDPVATPHFYQTKAPYAPQQHLLSYELPPLGYEVVYTQLVARHGSRGLSSLKYDLAVYNMWKKAETEGALTELGAGLGDDVLALMKANFLLGYGVPGIAAPGYGNETQTGIDEHTHLAQRLLLRLPWYWARILASEQRDPRQILVVTSGVDRAVDSGNFFVQSLTHSLPPLASLITRPTAPAPYPDVGTPVAQADGTNRFLLYFHKLLKTTDLVSKADNPLYRTYADSQAYQAYNGGDADLVSKQNALFKTAAARSAGRVVLERLFKPEFVDKIDAGTYAFANTGTFRYTSDDGKFSPELTGDGKTKIASLADAGALLYELYAIAPAMVSEAGVDFDAYLPAAQAQYFAELNDTSDFYSKGPGITEKADVTSRMAQILVDDLFAEVDAIAKNDLRHAAKLRFAHAEIMIPLATRMGIENAHVQVPLAQTYSYATNPWRGEQVSPMAANMQWDVYRNHAGKVLVKMLYNERETDFKAACDSAKVWPRSHFYEYKALRTCYGYR